MKSKELKQDAINQKHKMDEIYNDDGLITSLDYGKLHELHLAYSTELLKEVNEVVDGIKTKTQTTKKKYGEFVRDKNGLIEITAEEFKEELKSALKKLEKE